MKNLANCTPVEFLKQTNKIRLSVENWLEVTDIANIRKRMPELPKIDEDLSEEEKAKAMEERATIVKAQAKANLSAIIEALAEKHPEETVELLALLCFVEPKDANNHKMIEYLSSITELISDPDVIGFFGSLVRLVQANGLKELLA